MATSPLTGRSPPQPEVEGKDVDALGPSDSSDSGSDVQGELPMATLPDEPDELGAVPAELDTRSDAEGTGERASATGDDPRDAADIGIDKIRQGSDRMPAGGDADTASDTSLPPSDAACKRRG